MTHAGQAKATSAAEYARLLRVPYWSKNLLIFVPAFLANALEAPGVLLDCALGFLLLGICASGTYIANDLYDVKTDRAHATKRNRPLARKSVDPVRAALLAGGLITVPLIAASFWNPPFAACLLAYCVASGIYTVLIKPLKLADAFWLSGMHTSRLLMGVVLADVVLSGWLIGFSLFFFLSLAFAKRHCEVVLTSRSAGSSLADRPYGPADMPLILAFGASAAMASLVVLALYVTDGEHSAQYYRQPAYLWFAVAIVGAWLVHIWRHAHGGTMTADPVNHALRDRTSLVLFILLMVTMLLAK